MLKKLMLVLMACWCVVAFSGTASAGKFSHMADTGILNLGEDQKWEKSYHTSGGEIKIRFRNLRWASSEKKYHLIVWINDKRVADGYCPINKYGYRFKIFKERTTNRIFVNLEMQNRTVLFGYEPKNEKLEQYVDSKNYWSKDNGPTFLVDKEGDLQLRFVGDGDEYTTRYKLFWDEDARWFGYKDATKSKPVAPPPTPVWQPSAPSYAPTYDEVEYEDVYYEGS